MVDSGAKDNGFLDLIKRRTTVTDIQGRFGFHWGTVLAWSIVLIVFIIWLSTSYKQAFVAGMWDPAGSGLRFTQLERAGFSQSREPPVFIQSSGLGRADVEVLKSITADGTANVQVGGETSGPEGFSDSPSDSKSKVLSDQALGVILNPAYDAMP